MLLANKRREIAAALLKARNNEEIDEASVI